MALPARIREIPVRRQLHRARFGSVAAALAALLSLGLAVSGVRSLAESAGGIALTAMRCWSAPLSTRVVLDFSAPVTVVSPDSGFSRQLTLSIPADLVTRAPD